MIDFSWNFPSWAEPSRKGSVWAEPSQTWAFQFLSWNRRGFFFFLFFFALFKNYTPIFNCFICSMVISNFNDHLSEFIHHERYFWSWILQLHNFIIFKDENKSSKSIKISILEPKLFFSSCMEKVTSRAEPSWIFFSSNYGSSQLGSDSSLLGGS